MEDLKQDIKDLELGIEQQKQSIKQTEKSIIKDQIMLGELYKQLSKLNEKI